ncbi:hypothetical protein Syun_003969 [Stephania yunnanensis]|uniref:Large ribosomal subunit protein uL11 N-terminal domain-containing protein n=1 Tax=Stephania yunnanensis TaxID=152371 RepID=A0AAP0L3N6_9MAGN
MKKMKKKKSKTAVAELERIERMSSSMLDVLNSRSSRGIGRKRRTSSIEEDILSILSWYQSNKVSSPLRSASSSRFLALASSIRVFFRLFRFLALTTDAAPCSSSSSSAGPLALLPLHTLRLVLRPNPNRSRSRHAAEVRSISGGDVYVRVIGGEVGAASSPAPKIGPLGLSPKKIGEDIAKETAKDWKGLE